MRVLTGWSVPRQGSPVQTWNERLGSSDLDGGGLAEAEGRLRWDVLAADLVAVQPQRLQLGEVAHINNTAEAPQGELWRDRTGRRLTGLTSSFEERSSANSSARGFM